MHNYSRYPLCISNYLNSMLQSTNCLFENNFSWIADDSVLLDLSTWSTLIQSFKDVIYKQIAKQFSLVEEIKNGGIIPTSVDSSMLWECSATLPRLQGLAYLDHHSQTTQSEECQQEMSDPTPPQNETNVHATPILEELLKPKEEIPSEPTETVTNAELSVISIKEEVELSDSLPCEQESQSCDINSDISLPVSPKVESPVEQVPLVSPILQFTSMEQFSSAVISEYPILLTPISSLTNNTVVGSSEVNPISIPSSPESPYTQGPHPVSITGPVVNSDDTAIVSEPITTETDSDTDYAPKTPKTNCRRSRRKRKVIKKPDTSKFIKSESIKRKRKIQFTTSTAFMTVKTQSPTRKAKKYMKASDQPEFNGKCDSCDLTFTCEETMKTHVRTKHGIWKCKYCMTPTRFFVQWRLELHYVKHHDKVIFKIFIILGWILSWVCFASKRKLTQIGNEVIKDTVWCACN